MTTHEFFWAATGRSSEDMTREELMEVIMALLHVIEVLQGTEDKMH